MSYNFNFPSIDQQEYNRNKLEKLLTDVKTQIEGTYNDNISMLITATSKFNKNEEKVLSYALYLVFRKNNGFSYRLMEINCINADGGFPVEVNAFFGPSEYFGKADDDSALAKIMDDVFVHQRTRNVILSNY